VWFLREQKHTRDGLWRGNPLDLWFPGPKTITRVFLLPQKPHLCGFVETHSTYGFLGQRPSLVCFCSLRNHTRVVLLLDKSQAANVHAYPATFEPPDPWLENCRQTFQTNTGFVDVYRIIKEWKGKLNELVSHKSRREIASNTIKKWTKKDFNATKNLKIQNPQNLIISSFFQTI
jgi:hypothetical protein